MIALRTADQNIPFHIFPSVANADYRFVEQIIREENVTDVVIAGGDGTVSQVVGSLMHLDVNFGVIPCGSGNGLALTAGISKVHEKALDIVFNGNASPVDGFLLNKQFACMLCGIGFDAQIAHEFAKQETRGLGTYVSQIFKHFFSAKIYPFELQLKNTRLKTEAFFISIANSNQFGNNFTIAPQASLSDGLLDIVIVTSQNKLNFLLQTAMQVAGWNKLQPEAVISGKKGVIYFQAESLTVHNPEEAPVHIDGDPVETMDQLKVKILKDCFKLLQP